ncbi:zinc ribbon domain-containing protein [Amycolatopsis sp. FDAARGOS 1241]|uniref:zinc ribbon domain-containing protein n=1 Tax=Amycolatopsis sp. FDAARGOS 1241 TaxID=2778070 RepID=UPI001EF31256|nr:zinc ribbon domain-containing protein [Amycolatopsis sp. FDAARGOS 1241]
MKLRGVGQLTGSREHYGLPGALHRGSHRRFVWERGAAGIPEKPAKWARSAWAARQAGDGRTRRFALAGLIHCGVCDRRLDSHWNHGRPTYRCRHGHTSTQCAGQPRPKTLYIREDHLIDQISIRLGDQVNDDYATPELDRPRHRLVAAALRNSGKIIVYDGTGWRPRKTDSS